MLSQQLGLNFPTQIIFAILPLLHWDCLYPSSIFDWSDNSWCYCCFYSCQCNGTHLAAWHWTGIEFKEGQCHCSCSSRKWFRLGLYWQSSLSTFKQTTISNNVSTSYLDCTIVCVVIAFGFFCSSTTSALVWGFAATISAGLFIQCKEQ